MSCVVPLPLCVWVSVVICLRKRKQYFIFCILCVSNIRSRFPILRYTLLYIERRIYKLHGWRTSEDMQNEETYIMRNERKYINKLSRWSSSWSEMPKNVSSDYYIRSIHFAFSLSHCSSSSSSREFSIWFWAIEILFLIFASVQFTMWIAWMAEGRRKKRCRNIENDWECVWVCAFRLCVGWGFIWITIKQLIFLLRSLLRQRRAYQSLILLLLLLLSLCSRSDRYVLFHTLSVLVFGVIVFCRRTNYYAQSVRSKWILRFRRCVVRVSDANKIWSVNSNINPKDTMEHSETQIEIEKRRNAVAQLV